MKLGSSLWYVLLTAGLAVLAVVNPRPQGHPVGDAPPGDVDAWFV